MTANPLLKGDRYSRDPVKHLRTLPENHCDYWRAGDVVFIIGKTYVENAWGDRLKECPVCWPKKQTEEK